MFGEFTKSNLDVCLKELAKEFRRLSKKSMPAEIILIGGASVLANYGFRQSTYDMDAIVNASSLMKEAINNVGDKMGLPNGWLNTDFKQTKSYSDKLIEVSQFYKTFSNVLTVRTISAEYLVAMKLMSGRQYKSDLSDIVGILLEHKKQDNPLSLNAIKSAVIKLYTDWARLPTTSNQFINDLFVGENLEQAYAKVKETEASAKSIALNFIKNNPNQTAQASLNEIIEKAKKLRDKN